MPHGFQPISRALGHHSPAFNLTRYTHLPGDEAPALDLAGSGRIARGYGGDQLIQGGHNGGAYMLRQVRGV